MKPSCRLYLLILCVSLTACTANKIPDAPTVLKFEISESLTTCQKMPAQPCAPPAPPPPVPKVKPHGLAALGHGKPDQVITPDPTPVPRLCPEKERLRWEVLLMNWGQDCQSKLATVKGLLDSFNGKGPRAPPAKSVTMKKAR